MKDEETGLKIYGIPSAETREAMKEADEIVRSRRARFGSAEELFASLEKDSGPKAYSLFTINSHEEESETGKICLYSTAEEAMLHRKHGQQHVYEVRLKFSPVTP